ncbi:hypothetical protein ACTFIW_007444 [Dictyostelium discoideum]
MTFSKTRNKIIFLLFLIIINIFNINAYIKDENEDDLSLLISTLDGNIYSFNYESGELNWDLKPNGGDSLYSTSQFDRKQQQQSTSTEITKSSPSILIPTLDGSGLLFQYSNDRLHQVPFSLQELVNTSPLFLKELDDKSSTSSTSTSSESSKDENKVTMFIGNKKTSITVVDSQTGEIIKSMSKDGLWLTDEDDCPVNIIPDEALMFTRSDYQIIALDPKSGVEKWNLSVGEYIPHSTKSFYNSEISLNFEGLIEVASISQRMYKIYIKKPEKTVVGISHNYWEHILTSSPVSIYAYSSKKHILKKLDFHRKVSPYSNSLIPVASTDLMIPSNFDRTFMFDDYYGQLFIVSPPSNNNNNKNNNKNDNNNNKNESDKSNLTPLTPYDPSKPNGDNNNNNELLDSNKLKNYDIYLYSSIVILITSIIVFIRSKKNFNLINVNNQNNNSNNQNNNQNNNINNKKTPKKKKKKQKNKNNKNNNDEDDENEIENYIDNQNDLIDEFISTNSVIQQQQQQLLINNSNKINNGSGKIILDNGNVRIGKLEIITNKILGTGSCGTIVYEGKMEGRKVAVKRMLSQFVKFADREVSILIHSDEHTNVVRYYAKEEDDEFIYLAISFCQKSLDMYVQQTLSLQISPTDSPSIQSSNNNGGGGNNNNQIIIDNKTKQMIFELFKGLEHLHSLNIVHRDIKPHNVLIDPNNRVKISDMGLGKLLDNDDQSLTFTSDSHGWQPAEYLNGTNRNTKKVDIFSLGCVVYYLLTGAHPFGHRYNREKNVLKGKFDIDQIKHLPDIHQLVNSMIQFEPEKRPDIGECINHPFFWEVHKKLSFLVAASDYLEFEKPTSPLNLEIDSHVDLVTDGSGDWWLKIDQVLIDNIGRYRKYNGKSIRDLLRVIRNKFNHYRDLSPEEQTCLGILPDGFFNYFDLKFPQLFIVTYLFILKNLKNDQYFVQYYY